MFRSFIILIIAAAAVLQAQTITLKQAQDTALEKNYGYAIAKENVIYNEFSVKSAFSGFLPTASLSADSCNGDSGGQDRVRTQDNTAGLYGRKDLVFLSDQQRFRARKQKLTEL